MRAMIIWVGLFLAAAVLANAQPCIEYDEYLRDVAELHLPGMAEGSGLRDLVVKGRIAYTIGDYYMGDDVLQVIDLADDTAPVNRGQLSMAGMSPCRSIAAIDHFVLMGGQYLAIIDVDDHDNPVLAHTEQGSVDVRDVLVHHRLAYVVQGEGSVQVYSVELASSPFLLNRFTPPFVARRIAVTDDLLVVGGVAGVAVYSLENPGQPTLLGWTSVSGEVMALDAEGTQVVAGGTEVHVIDITDPTDPSVVADAFTTNSISCSLRDGVAWIGIYPVWGNGILERWNLADPTAPVRLGWTLSRGYPHGLAFAHGNVYSANWGDYWYDDCDIQGFHVYAGQNPNSPPLMGLMGLTIGYNSHHSSDLLGDYLYVVGTTDIDVIDLADPYAPVLVNSVYLLSLYVSGQGGVVVGDHLMVRMHHLVDNRYWWDVYNLDNPMIPWKMNMTHEIEGPVTAHGNLTYEGGYDGLRVFSMSESAELELLGHLWAGEGVAPPIFSDDQAAMVTGTHEIRLGTFNSPIEFTEQGLIPAPGDGSWRWPMAFEEGLLVTRSSDNRIWELWDVSDPGTPVLKYTSTPQGQEYLSNMVLQDGMLYMGTDRRIIVWDVSNPSAPVHLGDRPQMGREIDTWLHMRSDYVLATTHRGYIFTMPSQCSMVTGVQEDTRSVSLPTKTLRVAPNPFNPRTELSFELARTAAVELTLYDLKGRCVKHLIEGQLEAGSHAVTWDGRDDSGLPSAAGVYLARMVAGTRVEATRLVLVR